MMGEINWFATETGKALVADSIRQAKPWVWPLCGHNALLLTPDRQNSIAADLQCAPLIQLRHVNSLFRGDFIADDQNIPLVSDCMSLVYAAFVLETSKIPAALIAECERLLVSEGYLALLTLNPYNFSRLSGRWRRLYLKTSTQWFQHLQCAGLEVIRHESVGPLWARSSKNRSGSFSYRPDALRSVNFILAKKRRLTLTPIRKTTNTVALARESTQI
jgi:hypothetical protein